MLKQHKNTSNQHFVLTHFKLPAHNIRTWDACLEAVWIISHSSLFRFCNNTLTRSSTPLEKCQYKFNIILIHFWLMFPFFIPPEKSHQTKRFLVFSGGIKWEHWDANLLNLFLNPFKANVHIILKPVSWFTGFW